MGDLDRSLQIGDLDELLREVERRCDALDWEGVEEVRVRSRAAIERGHQLWPAASWAEYRIALDAPAEFAASVITDTSGYMAPGPLTEVVAQNHTWADLAEYLPVNAKRPLVAQERTIRGETVPNGAGGELPGQIRAWEPAPVLPKYSHHGLADPDPPLPTLAEADLVVSTPVSGSNPGVGSSALRGGAVPEANPGAEALRSGLAHWATRSNGTVAAVGFRGDTATALGAIGAGVTELHWWELTLADWAGLYSWASATGGSAGPRRGAASARFELWWTLATLLGIEEDWPLDPGPDCADLILGVWDDGSPAGGWRCRLTVEDPVDGLTWVVDATDRDPGRVAGKAVV